MPVLDWIGKEKVINHHLDVPFRVLNRKYSFDKNGQHEEDNGSENMIIHGDNLEALKALLPKYEGKIDCIYIDPPYNTGQESWIYNDNVNDPAIQKWLGKVVGTEGDDLSRHDKWLCMMYPRLKLLHRMLSRNGAIFVSIDDNEIEKLRIIMDEIFGSEHFVTQITLLCNPKGRSQDKYFAANHEYLLVYKKGELPPGAFSIEKSEQLIAKDYPEQDQYGRFRRIELRNTHREFGRFNRPNLWYAIYADPDSGAVSLTRNSKYNVEIYPFWNDGFEGCWTWGKEATERDIHLLVAKEVTGRWKVYRKSYANVDGKIAKSKLFTIWNSPLFYTEKGQKTFSDIFPGTDKTDFPQPKSVDYIMEAVKTITDKSSIVLDSFAGSGTTAHAVMNLNKEDGGNRSFILIELMDYADTITAERVKRVITGYECKEKQEDILFSEKLNVTQLRNGEDLIEEANQVRECNLDNYDKVSRPTIKDNYLQVIGTNESKVFVSCADDSFSYYELGDPLLIDEKLNENVGSDKIREYIYFTETRQMIPIQSKDEPALLGKHLDTAYYFYYVAGELTTLNRNWLQNIKTKASSYVIYADLCTLSDHELTNFNITFKKIPRDITKL